MIKLVFAAPSKYHCNIQMQYTSASWNENNSDEMIIAGYSMEDGNYSFYGEAIVLV